MEKILIIGCDNVMNTVCIACSRCLVALNRREGEFKQYKDQEIELLGLLSCGGCPGAGIVPRLAQVALWNKPFDEKPTKIHIGPCIIDHCPYNEALIKKIKAKAGIEVIEGAHSYIPENVFS